jgi:hypothetical protein
MTEQEQYQAKLKEAYLIEEARLTAQRLYQQGFAIGAGGTARPDESANGYVVDDYIEDYFV